MNEKYYMMDEMKAERIRNIVGWIRLAILLTLLFIIGATACERPGVSAVAHEVAHGVSAPAAVVGVVKAAGAIEPFGLRISRVHK